MAGARTWWLVVAALAALGVAACVPGRCLTTADCPEGQRCRGGRCREPAGPPDAAVDADAGADADVAVDGDAPGDAEADEDRPEDGDVDGDDDADADEVFACPAAAVGARLGRRRLLMGAQIDAVDPEAAPLDIHAAWIVNNVPEGGPCESCAEGCFVDGFSCADAGCAWWGCWQWDGAPPGRYVADLVQASNDLGAVPFVTQLIWQYVAVDATAEAQLAALADPVRVASFLADHRFLCQVLAEDPSVPAILHVEPYLFAHAHQTAEDPTAIPAEVGAAGAPECAALPDDLSGFARCLVAIARAEAPNVLVAFHAWPWAAGDDALMNWDPAFDLLGHARRTAAFLRDLGAGEGDLIVIEMSDRDAALDGRWWDDTNRSLPSFLQALLWARAVGDGLSLGHLWYRVPFGHMGLPNRCGQQEDNRLEYFMAHPADFAAAGAIGAIFGANGECVTTPVSDGSFFYLQASLFAMADPVPLCGP